VGTRYNPVPPIVSSGLFHLAEEGRWRNVETPAEPHDVVAVQPALFNRGPVRNYSC
jgi:hypothetical protein